MNSLTWEGDAEGFFVGELVGEVGLPVELYKTVQAWIDLAYTKLNGIPKESK